MGTNRLPDETEFKVYDTYICETCYQAKPLIEFCSKHHDDVEECEECCPDCQGEEDMNPPDTGKGSIYVDPEGIR